MSLRTVAIIQARMGSTRLHGKVLMKLADRSVLEHVVERALDSAVFDDIIVATTTEPADDAITEVASKRGVNVFRGSEKDVLLRYVYAAAMAHADVVARITSDCPLIDPQVLADMVHRFLDLDAAGERIDLVTNARRRTFPRGLDAEIVSMQALEAAHHEGTEPHHREHVTPFIYEHPERFVIVDHLFSKDASAYRLTLDTHEDYVLLQKIFEAVPEVSAKRLRIEQALNLLMQNPEWSRINSHIKQKELRDNS